MSSHVVAIYIVSCLTHSHTHTLPPAPQITYRHVRLKKQQQQRSPAGGHQPPSSQPSQPSQPPQPQPPMLLIKSPVHTARLATWLRLFPRARFVFVHRHPLEVGEGGVGRGRWWRGARGQ